MTSKRKYFHSFSELIDRLSILQLKEIFIIDNKKEYADEIKLILNDLDIILQEEKPKITAEILRAMIIISQFNLHIWHHESCARDGNKENADLFLTHSLNGVRTRSRNIIEKALGGRIDKKIDCLAAEYCSWEPSW